MRVLDNQKPLNKGHIDERFKKRRVLQFLECET